MTGIDMMLENAIKLLIARIPQANIDQLANIIQIAVNLDAKLNRIEQSQGELRTLLIALVETLQPKGISNDRSAESHNAGNHPSGA